MDNVPRLLLGNAPVTMTRAIKYLGIMVDDNLYLIEHVKATADKAHNVMRALSMLMPNIG